MRQQHLRRKHLVRRRNLQALCGIICYEVVTLYHVARAVFQGMQNFGGIRVGNGPTEDDAEIIQHDQLAQQSEDEPEVKSMLSAQTLMGFF